MLDPLCDHPGTLIEAIRLGRDALGLTDFDPERNGAQADALVQALRDGASGTAQLLVGEPCDLARLLARKAGPLLNRRAGAARLREFARHPCGAVDLVLLGATLLPPEQRQPRRRHWWTAAASGDQLLSACTALLKPGGFLVLAAPTETGEPVGGDRVSELVRAGQSHGLQYWQHVIALHAPIKDGQLHPAGAATGERCHGDLLVFRKPGGAADDRHRDGSIDPGWAE